MSEPIDISQSQRKELLALIRRYLPNTEVWAFGSRVKWTARSNSDLDLVAFAKQEDEGRVSQLKEALEESSLPFRVDLLVWDNIPESFRANILEHRVPLVELKKDGQGRAMFPDTQLTPYGPLSNLLNAGRLGDLCLAEGVQTGPFGSQLHQEDYVTDGTPIITVEHLGDNRIVHQNLPRVSNEDRQRLAKYSLRTGDIVFSRVGSVDRRAIVGNAENGWLFSGRCLRVRPNPEKLDSQWLSYFFGLPAFKQYIRGIAVGATMPSINTKILSDVPIYFPTLPQQRSAAKFLTSLDDKIETNRRINQTLEAMAQAIFKSWFVDFDPVKAKIAAKAEGRDPLRAAMSAISGKPDAELDALPPEQYKQLAATAALFPDEMVESELGEIPKGWVPATLSTVCKLNSRSWSTKTLPASVRYVDLANTKNGEIIEVQAMDGGNIPSRARRVLEKGDTIVGTVRPGNRSFALVGEDGLTGSTGFAVLNPKENYLREYVYLAATAETNIERLGHLADGGAYPAVRPELVVSDPLPIPKEDLLRDFHRISSPMFDQVFELRRANRDLADLRDTLLPKLLSGELSVTELVAEAH